MPCKHSFVHTYLQFCCSVLRRIGFWVGGGPTRLQRWSWFRSSQERASRVFAPKPAVNRKRGGPRMAPVCHPQQQNQVAGTPVCAVFAGCVNGNATPHELWS